MVTEIHTELEQSALAPSFAVPATFTSFVGRARELALVGQHLETSRIVTLTGAGGSGKTRLALEAATRLAARFPDGVAVVELAPLLDPELLAAHVAEAVRIHEEGDRPTLESLTHQLRDRSMLLVLDNCEHLVDACATLAMAILQACPGIRVLATSREALAIAGEKAWLVPPLSLPSAEASESVSALLDSEAVRLFVDRAQNVLPSFALSEANAPAVARICRRLDGLPLAIELAAARVRVLTPAQIAERLERSFEVLSSRGRGVPPRHQTLGAAVDWSYQLLSETERALLDRLSVFAGDFTLESVEAICPGDGLDPAELLDLVAALVEKSLVVMHERDGVARYSLLELVRQFAAARLAADSALVARVHRRHAHYYLSIAEAARPHIQASAARDWLDRVGREHDNFRVALERELREPPETSLAPRLAENLWMFWFHRHHWSEGLRWMEAALAHGDPRPTHTRVVLLNGSATCSFLTRNPALTRERLEEAVRIVGEIADPSLFAQTHYRMAYLLTHLGEFDAALAYAERGVRAALDAGELRAAADVLVYGVGFCQRGRGDLARADEAYAEAERLALQVDARLALVEAMMGRTAIALERGDVSSAVRHAGAGIAAARRFGDAWYTSRILCVVAATVLHGGSASSAAVLLGAGEALRQRRKVSLFLAEQPYFDALMDRARRELGESEFSKMWDVGVAMADDDTLDFGERALASLHVPEGGEVRVAESPPEDRAPAVAALRVLALGPLVVERDGVPLSREQFGYARPRELFLYLLMHPDGRTREQLGLVFWPEASAAQLKNNFHVALHQLRKALGRTDVIVFDQGRYRIDWGIGVELDVRRFEQEVTDALRTARGAEPELEPLRQALALYRGDFLEGEVVGDWHLAHRDALRRLWVDGMLRLGDLLVDRQRHAEAADVFRTLVMREELHERACRELMRAHARLGDRTSAMRQYERLAALLAADFDAEPEPETRQLYENIRRGEHVDAP